MIEKNQSSTIVPKTSEGYASRRVPAMVYPYVAGIYGGLLGGLTMVPVALAYGLVSGHGVWYPVNLIAATLVRPWQQAGPVQLAEFSFPGLFLGLAIHIAVAAGLGLVFAVLSPTLPGHPLPWTFLVGPILWFGAVYAALPLLNPVMARYIDLTSFAIANVLYSVILGLWMAHTPKIPA